MNSDFARRSLRNLLRIFDRHRWHPAGDGHLAQRDRHRRVLAELGVIHASVSIMDHVLPLVRSSGRPHVPVRVVLQPKQTIFFFFRTNMTMGLLVYVA